MAEIPDQLLKFFKSKGIVPNPPRPAAPLPQPPRSPTAPQGGGGAGAGYGGEASFDPPPAYRP